MQISLHGWWRRLSAALFPEHHPRRKRPLRALQVEVTSRCTRRCKVCPRSPLSPVWREGDLEEASWQVLGPDLCLAEHVHLQGWGEPLLHRRTRDWASAAQRAGSTVGITTNGDLLADSLDWLLEGDVNLVTISVAGDSRTHAALRDGSELEPILEAARELALGARRRRIRLEVKLAYLLTRGNATDLPAAIEAAARARLDEVFVTHLDCTPSPELLDQSAFTDDGLRPEVAGALDHAATVARRAKVRYREPPRHAEPPLTCALDPTRFVFVGWDGRVAPCVNLLLPIDGPIPRWAGAGEQRVQPVSYGRLGDARLSELLNSETQLAFVAPLRRRLAAEQRFLASVLSAGTPPLNHLEQADADRAGALAASPFPEACAACPKASGW